MPVRGELLRLLAPHPSPQLTPGGPTPPAALQARQHWLVVARDRRLQGPLDLTAADAGLMQHMLVCCLLRMGV